MRWPSISGIGTHKHRYGRRMGATGRYQETRMLGDLPVPIGFLRKLTPDLLPCVCLLTHFVYA